MTRILEMTVVRTLGPWSAELGADRDIYINHVLRLLSFCDLLSSRAPGDRESPSARDEFVTAAVFHDLGVWTARTLDYLAPSIELAAAWLIEQRREQLIPLVSAMIDDHHKLRRANDPNVELFRRADMVDVSAGLRRFGIPRHEYRAVVNRHPANGFHRRLAELGIQRVRNHPLSPLPMVKW